MNDFSYALGFKCANFQQKITSDTSWGMSQTSRSYILQEETFFGGSVPEEMLNISKYSIPLHWGSCNLYNYY